MNATLYFLRSMYLNLRVFTRVPSVKFFIIASPSQQLLTNLTEIARLAWKILSGTEFWVGTDTAFWVSYRLRYSFSRLDPVTQNFFWMYALPGCQCLNGTSAHYTAQYGRLPQQVLRACAHIHLNAYGWNAEKSNKEKPVSAFPS